MLSPFRPQKQFSILRLAKCTILGAIVGVGLWVTTHLVCHAWDEYIEEALEGDRDDAIRNLRWDLENPEEFVEIIGLDDELDRIGCYLISVVGAVFGTALYVFVRRRSSLRRDQ